MNRKKDVLMVFDFLIELLKEKENVSNKIIIEETKSETVKEKNDDGKSVNFIKNFVDTDEIINEATKSDETFDLASNLRHASMLMKRIEEKDKEQAGVQSLLNKQRKEYEEEIKRLKEINHEKNLIQKEEEAKELLTENIPTGEFTNQAPRIVLDNEDEKKVEKDNVDLK